MTLREAVTKIEADAAAADERGRASADPAEHGEGHREALAILKDAIARLETMKRRVNEYAKRDLAYMISFELLTTVGMTLEWVLGDDAYQEVPFERMVEDLGKRKGK